MKKILIKILVLLLPFLIAYPFLESQLNQVEVLTTSSSHGDAVNPDHIRERTFTLNKAAQDL